MFFSTGIDLTSHIGKRVERAAVITLAALLFSIGVASPAAASELLELPRLIPEAGGMGTQERAGSVEEDPNVASEKTTLFDLSLEGSFGYTISYGTVRIEADRVFNRRSYGVSGTIRLELWAFSSPYNGAAQLGHKLGQTTLGTLAAGWYYHGIDQTVDQLTTLPTGTWYLALIVTEYNNSALNDGFSPVDWGNFSNPWVIGPPATARVTVYELYNTITKHYFRTANPVEVAGIEAGSAGAGWVRTWDDFTAYAALAGSTGNDVCRFYSYYSNSHFYTASEAECNTIRYGTSEWKYEGLSFRIPLPSSSGCMSGQTPVYRLYNNRYMFHDSNHRFTTSFSEVERLRAWPNYWVYEGIAFCALN